MMRVGRVVIGVALLAASISGFAEWKWTGRSDDYIYFYDPQTKARDGDLVTYWQMVNYVDKAPDGTASMAIQRQISCGRMESKQLFKVRFNDEMGTGDRVGKERVTGEDAEFTPIVPGTWEMKLQAALCAK